MKTYICTKCNERVVESRVIMDHDPETWHSPMREMIDKIRGDDGRPKDVRLFHTVHVYGQWGGTQHMALCGPLRLSDEGDEYISWLDQCAMNSKCVK